MQPSLPQVQGGPPIVNHYMTQFARRAGVAGIKLTVDDHADPIAGAKGNITHMLGAAPRAKTMLTQGAQIGVVL